MAEVTRESTGTCVILSTCPPDQAVRIGRELVDRHVAACINIINTVTSIYRWEGKVCEDAESLLVIKTSRERVEELIEAVVEIHPYTVPEVIAMPITAGNEAYLKWVTAETASAPTNGEQQA